MAAVNWQTWTRLQRLKLQGVAGDLSNASMSAFNHWPTTGEGRSVKAASEKMLRLLARANATSDLPETVSVLNEAVAELERVTENDFFHKTLASTLIPAPLGRRIMLGERVHSAILEHRSFLRENDLPRSSSRNEDSPIRNPPAPRDTFASTVPAQKSGPARFAFEHQLTLASQAAQAKPASQSNAANARVALIELGDDLVSDFSMANYDNRLLRSIQRVQQKLRDGADIIQTGIASMACTNVSASLQHELSDALIAQIDTYNVGVSLYIGQFSEWSSFVEDAQATEFSTADAERVISTSKVLASNLREQSDLVDPEVPRTIELIVEAMGNPRKSTQRAFFAAVRTVENLASVVLSRLGGLVDAAWTGITDGTKEGMKTVSKIALLAAVAAAAASLAPATGGVVGAGWLRKAGKMTTEALSKIELSKSE